MAGFLIVGGTPIREGVHVAIGQALGGGIIPLGISLALAF